MGRSKPVTMTATDLLDLGSRLEALAEDMIGAEPKHADDVRIAGLFCQYAVTARLVTTSVSFP